MTQAAKESAEDREVPRPTCLPVRGSLRAGCQACTAARDLDAVFHGSLDELLADLDAAFAEPYSGFSLSHAVEIFKLRTTHGWPPTLTVQPNWPDVYVCLAAEIDFPIADAAEAAARVQALIDRICAA